MKKQILLVEDKEGQQKLLIREIEANDIELLPVCDSLQDVIDNVINVNLLPDCAIIDAQIFKESQMMRSASTRPDSRWGLEVVERLLSAGLQPRKILILTAFKQTVESGLRGLATAEPIRIIEKPIHSQKLKAVINELLTV